MTPTNNDTALEKIAVNWFMSEITFEKRIELANQYFPEYAEDNTDLDDCEILSIYLKEVQPPTPAEKLDDELRMAYKSADQQDWENKTGSYAPAAAKEEETVDGEWTKGEWRYKIYDNDIFQEIEISVDGIRTCVIPYLDAPAKANALRIVECVNNFQSVVDALKEVLGMCEYPYKEMATYKQAKALINTIEANNN